MVKLNGHSMKNNRILEGGEELESPQYLNEKQVARITGSALPSLRNDRCQRKGIPYCKVGRSVRYRMDDVIRFMESHKIKTEEA